jgi:tetratricopeptide (TPR) repeat protein
LGVVLIVYLLTRSLASVRRLRRRILGRVLRKGSEEAFRVVVSDLEQDDGLSQTKLLAEVLGRNKGIKVRLLGRPIVLSDVGELATIRSAAQRDAAKQLVRLNADLLIFGRVAGDYIHLYWAARDGTLDQPRLYRINDGNSEKKQEILKDLDTQLHAVTLAYIRPTDAQQREELRQLLEGVSPKLLGLIQQKPSSDSSRLPLLRAYGKVAHKLGMLCRGTTWFSTGVKTYRDLLAAVNNRESSAETQYALGECLADWGDMEGDPSMIKEGLEQLDAALQFYTFEEHPIRWGRIALLRAFAAYSLGQITGDKATLKDSVELARKVVDRSDSIGDRFITKESMSILGLALTAAGVAMQSEDALAEAVVTLRNAVAFESFTDVLIPSTNLGQALHALGKLRNDPRLLAEAASVCISVLSVQNRNASPRDWARCQNLLGLATLELGIMRRHPAQATKAIKAFKQSLEIFEHDTAPRDWAAATNNLGYALRTLAQWRREPALLESAISHFSHAATTFERVGAHSSAKIAKANVAGATRELAELRGD